MQRVLEDAELRARLISAGRERSKQFQWRRCAQETLHVLEEVGPRKSSSKGQQMTYPAGARS